MPTHNQHLGKFGEKAAAAYLEARGYRILGHNIRTPYGEIDILAQDGETLVFVEVKTRRGTKFGFPEEAITPRKWQHMAQAAEHWCSENEVDAECRIDVIAVLIFPNRRPEIEHYQNLLGVQQ